MSTPTAPAAHLDQATGPPAAPAQDGGPGA